MSDLYFVETYSNSLEHHGVKGMKWGVRKARIKKGFKNAQKKSL